MQKLKLIFLLIFALLIQSCNEPPHWHASDVTGTMPDLYFTLTGTEGQSVDARSLLGKPVLVFFGFTNCPNVCPTTLTQLSVIMKALGPAADDIKVLLVTVDPERDSPEVMKRYTASFGPWLEGLTGPQDALSRLQSDYGVYVSMSTSPEKGSYNVMHTTAIFAFDRRGRARLLISDVSDIDAVVSDLQQLINL